MSEPASPQGPEPSGWVIGGISFAAVMLITIGVFQIISGIGAIVGDDVYVIGAEYAFNLYVSGWGWIHLILGVAVALTGLALLGRRPWAGIVTIMLAALSAIANFFFIPYYPFWSLLEIGLAIWVIWAVTRPGALEESTV